MDIEFKKVMIDALTEALERNLPVTIKNSANSSIIALTATEGKIIMSLSKMPNLLDDLIHILSDALGTGPDLVYNRISIIKEDFIIYYVVWIRDDEESKGFIEQEFAMPQNHITFMSPKTISLIKDSPLKIDNN
ncbi:MAG: hypothetical protein K0R80_1024 [Clostridia bacterium]|jgi:hypothetical protein|nr:hypothetical protein [Clostridia bacterium]MDF2890657.1 hypothetical protein [Clostridia bacterium]